MSETPPSCSGMTDLPERLRLIQIDRADRSPAHAAAFDMVPATCPKVGEALNELRQEIEQAYRIKPEDSVDLDLAIHRAIARIKTNATEPLRRALIYACSRSAPPMKTKFALINTFNALPGRLGSVVSFHRTEAAAIAADVKLQKAVKRANGQSSYLPTIIVEVGAAAKKSTSLEESWRV